MAVKLSTTPVYPTLPVHPVSRPVVVDENSEMAEYLSLAKTLDFHPRGLEDPTLDQVLQCLGIEVFNLEAVAAFLTATCTHLGSAWRWEWAPVVKDWKGLGAIPYREPIPLRVLRRMYTLRSEAPKVEFYVSRITTQEKADPFLLATLNKVNRVIDCWDEPGFTG